MWIGVGRIVLDFYGNEKAAVKHRRLDELCKSIRKKFNISILEVADFDDPERCVIGFAAACPEHWHERDVHALAKKVAATIDDRSFARVTVEDVEVLSHGDFE